MLATRQPTGAADLTVGPLLAIDDERVLAVAQHHPLAGRPDVSVEVLGDYPVAHPAGYTTAMEEAIIPRVTPAGRPVVRTITVGSMAELFAAVARGEVVHLTVSAMKEYSGHPGVTYIPVPDAPPSNPALMWCTTNDDPRIAAFVAVADEVLGSINPPPTPSAPRR